MTTSLDFGIELDTNQWVVGTIYYESEDDWGTECVYLIGDPNSPWDTCGVNITEYYDLYTFAGKSLKDMIEAEAYDVIEEHNQYRADEYADYLRDQQMTGD